ncbi:MAG: hypothetical protein QOG75_5708 [Mycobacterium sp.]|nr:hypothetical protein [Mycobacterium sp.]
MTPLERIAPAFIEMAHAIVWASAATVPSPVKKANGPEPVGYDASTIPMWAKRPTSDQFAASQLSPYRLRVIPGSVMMKGVGVTLSWTAT